MGHRAADPSGERWGEDPELLLERRRHRRALPAAVDELPLDDLSIDPDEIDDIVISHLPSTALFSSKFREAAARSLLLPRRRPDRRTPLWQQRQRAADLLSVAVKYPQFPVLLEATREICNDVFDLPALRQVLADIRSRRVRVVPVDTERASPMAQSLPVRVDCRVHVRVRRAAGRASRGGVGPRS